jgi:polyhydroxyalkanoate synthase
LGSIAGNVAGSLLDLIAIAAAPATFAGSRTADWMDSLGAPDAMRTHLRVERWTLDESPMPRRLFGEIVELLYRGDRFMRGQLWVRGRRAAPERVRCPVLSILNAHSRIVPPGAVLPFHAAVHAADRRVLWYRGDTGVCLPHVGALVGGAAHRQLWPRVMRWIDSHCRRG